MSIIIFLLLSSFSSSSSSPSKSCQLVRSSSPGADCFSEPECGEKCSTVQEQQCSTVQQQQCSTVNQQKCSTEYKQQCSTTQEQKCQTVNEQKCDKGMSPFFVPYNSRVPAQSLKHSPGIVAAVCSMQGLGKMWLFNLEPLSDLQCVTF